ncbi:MAG: segregation/condensation protein A [Blautia sp.]|nr:segregation/condensation protein A [Blautia sp.]
MAIPVKLTVFEGPLDLLLHLIEKNKIDIYDIPIVEITRQYMDYVRSLQGADMEVTSEFMVMAATLLDIKCRMLLPRTVGEDGKEEDPRSDLVQRLLEYKLYRYMAMELRERLEDAGGSFYHKKDLPEEVKGYEEPVVISSLLEGITLDRLQKIYKGLVKKQTDRVDTVRSQFGKIEKEPVSISEKMLEALMRRPFADRIRAVPGDFFLTDWGEGYDAVISTSALHHFDPADKARLYRKVWDCLRDGGQFLNSDKVSADRAEEARDLAEYAEDPCRWPHMDTPLAPSTETELLENAGFVRIAVGLTDQEDYRLFSAEKPVR